jgi:hypothetical protein
MPRTPKPLRVPRRPLPPDDLGARFEFMPAPEVRKWIDDQLFAEDGAIHNPDHAHLIGADIAVLWADGGFTSKMRTVIGTAEEVAFRCNAWQRGRQEQQMREWFGRVPKFLITLDGQYSRECSDADWCALVEHELSHIAHERDEFGSPKFARDGQPKLCIRSHDVEEFIGVVQRYGVGSSDSAVARLVAAAHRGPSVSRASMAGACGTCHLKVA